MVTEKEVEEMMQEMVNIGHAVNLGEGRYKVTDLGKYHFAIHQILEVMNYDHSRAYTFGALIFLVRYESDVSIFIEALAQLISDKVVHEGIVSDHDVPIFHGCNHQKQLHVYRSPKPDQEGRWAKPHLKRLFARVREINQVQNLN